MQKELKNIMHIKTYSAHRESTPFGIRKHAENVKNLRRVLEKRSILIFLMDQLDLYPQERRLNIKSF